jgi:protein SCO1/2
MSRNRGYRSASGSLARVCLVAVALVCSPVLSLLAQKSRPDAGTAATQPVAALKEIGIDQKPNAKLPLDAEFSDENGAPVKLGQFFGPRPVVMALVYYGCPMLCTQVLNGLAGSLQGLSFSAGQEYDVVVVSFDPGETPAMATERKTQFVSRYIRAADTSRIHFLTGRESSIKALTTAVGFRYAWDKQTGQFAHPAAITVLTPDGRISRYLYGVEFAPKDLKLALIEASAGEIGSVVDQAMLFCYHYDPETGRYGLAIMNLVRAAGALTVLVIGGWIFMSLRRERRQASAVAPTATTGTR